MRVLFVLLFAVGCAIQEINNTEYCENEVKNYNRYSSVGYYLEEQQNKRNEEQRKANEAFARTDLTPLTNWVNQTFPKEQSKPVKHIEMRCIRDCRANGYDYNFCESKCSY